MVSRIAVITCALLLTADLPADEMRSVEFEVDEATWMSLDVSPDAQTVVFDLLGDIYRLSMDGGRAVRLTSGPGFDSQPVFSPDGKKIAFISDRSGNDAIWIAGADGFNPQQLTFDPVRFTSPEWTPDGDYILVSRGKRVFELWMYHVLGGAGVRLTHAKDHAATPLSEQRNALGAVMSADGRYLYYTLMPGFIHWDARFPLCEIVRRDLTDGVESVVVSAQGSAFRPMLSPDGESLVYGTRLGSGTALRVRNLMTGADRQLIFPVERDAQEGQVDSDLLPRYTFTPDSRSILVSRKGKINVLDAASGKSRVLPFAARVQQSLSPLLRTRVPLHDDPATARLIMAPRLSPDGDYLAFSAFAHLYVMKFPGGKPRRVTRESAGEYQPVWSADGNWLAYVTWRHGQGAINKIRMDASGGNPVQLTSIPAFFRDPVWTPDGQRILAIRGNAYERLYPHAISLQGAVGISDLISVSTSSDSIRVIAAVGDSQRPHFADNSERVYLSSQGRLISLRMDGSDLRDHLMTGYSADGRSKLNGHGIELAVRADGKWVLVRAGGQLHLMTAPKTGSQVEMNVDIPAGPHMQLSRYGADYFSWENNGSTIMWSVGSTVFRVSFDSIMEAILSGQTEPLLAEETPVKVRHDRREPKEPLLLSGGRVITMRGDEILERGDVLVDGGRIAAVGPADIGAPPAGLRVIDISGLTVIPGFIDVHAHWGPIRPDVLDDRLWTFEANLAYGITSSLDVQGFSHDIFGYRDLLEAGVTLGPRGFSTGPGVMGSLHLSSREEVFNVLAKYRRYYGTSNLKSYYPGNRQVRQWIAEACQELGLMPTAEGAASSKLILTHVLDGFASNEHNLPVTPLYEDVVKLLARSQTAINPTFVVAGGGPVAKNYYLTHHDIHDDEKVNRFVPRHVVDSVSSRLSWYRNSEYVFPAMAADMLRIADAGGIVGIGSHGELAGLSYHWEMWSLSHGGWSPMRILRSATLDGARIIGRDSDLGSIEPGKLADLLIFDADPSADIRNTSRLQWVMRNGELYDARTLNQIFPIQQALPPPPFRSDPPPRPH